MWSKLEVTIGSLEVQTAKKKLYYFIFIYSYVLEINISIFQEILLAINKTSVRNNLKNKKNYDKEYNKSFVFVYKIFDFY